MRHPGLRGPIKHSSGRPHPRNRHGERYDFVALVKVCPELSRFVIVHPCGGDTIDFSEADGVKTLNCALLKAHYGIEHWDIPPGYLCPPIPSRADYVHHVADLLSEGHPDRIPRGAGVQILDIGVGANCVYPIIGSAEYGWRFVGSEIDRVSIDWARRLIATNPVLKAKVECRAQSSPADIFAGIVKPSERFDAAMCNPPFHGSAEEAASGTLRKLKNLGLAGGKTPIRNFAGQSTELWCDGGEAGFVRRMIFQSTECSRQFLWFTALVSKRGSLPAIYGALHAVRALDVRTIPMAQGQKQSRLVAWTFQTPSERSDWHTRRGL